MPTAEPQHSYQVQLPEFEGPLDLLLHLVKRHELDVLSIPIAFVTEKYLEYLDLMRSLNLDIAGEYLLMAATLAHIKSREMLPRHPEEQQDDDDELDDELASKEQLIRRLLEYQRYRDAAERLGEQPLFGRQVFPRGVTIEAPDGTQRELAEVSTFALLSAFADVLGRSKIDLRYEVIADRVSIGDRINSIVDQLDAQQTLRLLDCLGPANSPAERRHEVVVTFLALLEMARLQMVRVLQDGSDGTIYLTRTAELRRVDELDSDYD